ncbi:uncharacterized protein LOC133794857 [Humulus lupulus]|uniref:uncharacterized protein LOC133794857 n=1 Tax=Humulus lupulus TaxID=3486 RepID=UPI002B410887|nr:uncharacterized protein LOC133794857 [Humulus lupulus]
MKGDEEKFKQLYTDSTPSSLAPSRPLTVSQDSLLHIAIYMGRKTIAKEILNAIKRGGGGGDETLTTRNAHGDTVLHEVAATDMMDLATEMMSMAPNLLVIPNNLGESPLFRAAHHGQAQMFGLLADEVDKKNPNVPEFHLSRACDSTTILHISILAEFFDLAFDIAKRYPDLVNKKDESGMIGLQLLSSNPSAFKSGRNLGLLKRLLYYCMPSSDDQEVLRREGKKGNNLSPTSSITRFMQLCRFALNKINVRIWGKLCKGWPMMGDIYSEKKKHESAQRLAKLLIEKDTSWEVSRSNNEDSNMGKISIGMEKGWSEEDNNDNRTTTSVQSHAATEGQSNQRRKEQNSRQTTTTTTTTTDHLHLKEITTTTYQLDPLVPPNLKAVDSGNYVKDIKGYPIGGGLPNPTNEISGISSESANNKKTQKAKKASSYPPPTSLLIATNNGIVEIVTEILRVYPQAVEHVSDMGQNILHVAIKHRKLEIFRLVKRMQFPMSRLVRRIDVNGYTILHHVGVMMYYTGGTLPGPALQLQEELHWFKRVRKIIPPHYEMHKSHYGNKSETAEELFSRTHESLFKEAQEWLKRTSESCSTVAVLIATVAFAAAYTVPGGSDDDTGIPILLTDPFFLVFTVMDVLSLASSLTSVVMFLSILTSPFHLQDFHRTLPRKLILAFTFLFFSVAVTMLAFAATIILIVRLKKSWTRSIIYTVAFLPVTVFALLQFPLYLAFMDTMRSSLKFIKTILPSYTLPRCIMSKTL